MSALKYWLWLATRRGVGIQGVQRVLEHFGTPEQAYFADPGAFELLPRGAAEGLRDRSMDKAERILADCDRLGIRIMTIQDADYPERLRQLEDAPCILYLKGRISQLDEEVTVGIVGSREASEYGKQVAGRLGLELARGGAVVVSGTAAGIDSCAVRGALRGGGRAVCVLGGGIDVPYPKWNAPLYQDVAASGLLISEYPPGTTNDGPHFPVRNRIISGLSLGVVVVEAKEYGSGAVITANHALEQNRDVFAVPGNVDAHNSRGCNRLIQQGAKPVLSAEDILVEYRDRYPVRLVRVPPLSGEEAEHRLEQTRTQPDTPLRQKTAVDKTKDREYSLSKRSRQGLTDDEIALLHALRGKSAQPDELVELTQIPARRVLSALTMLQIAGCVEEKPGKRFVSLVELTDES
ncbi:MAG: DNA-processing protein DprA [Oscillospiraceae bacterium]|nr:DNA-processing protein DprA [Oscillospiraceae bacterium]